MATAVCQLSEDQFCCSICLEVFTDPTSLPCGHNFCKTCIERYWTTGTAVHNCPYCKHVFTTKPELKVNIFISEMSNQFRQSIHRNYKTQQEAKPEEISCDVCEDPKSKAQKSCLDCSVSYCGAHLKPHHTVPALKRHTLTEPQTHLEGKLCPEHGKVLDVYCENDDTCICALCVHRHKRHKVAPLREVSEQKRQQLMRTQSEIERLIQTRQSKIQELRLTVELPSADSELSEGLRVFSALRDAVDRALEELYREVSEKQEAVRSQTEDQIQELETEIFQLQARLIQVEQLTQSNNHLQILQNYKKLRLTPQMQDWTSARASPPTFEGIVVQALSKLEREFNKTTQKMFEEELMRVRRFETLITLDGDTAHPQLVVSQNGFQVNYSIEQRRVQNSVNRFEDFFVLGKQSFRENFYFEVEVRGKTEWTLGVAKETLNKKGALKLDPQNGIWAISLKDKNIFACADPEIPLFPKAKPEKIGVFVSYGEGSVSFYDVENAALVHSFSGFCFRQRLQPLCSPGHYSYGNFSPLVVCQNSPSARRMTWPVQWATIG
ncbi:hypothetical protein NQD34_003577 [Periophthalmus magnuspinnatus]|nr:hypothetical protein NQD34_003577 [Periophthalmus magnuspinnatus]